MSAICQLTQKGIKIDFFCENNTTKHTTFSGWPTGQHLTVWDASTYSVNTSYCAVEEDSAQIPLRDIMVCGKMIHSIPQGNKDSKRTSQCRRGRKQPMPRRTGHLRREVTSDTTHDWHEILCRDLCSCGEPKCEHFVVPGAQNFCSARRQRTMALVLGHLGQINLLFLLPQCHSQLERGHHHNFSYLTIMCDYHNDLCVLKGVHFNWIFK